jgi:hypothetical protein
MQVCNRLNTIKLVMFYVACVHSNVLSRNTVFMLYVVCDVFVQKFISVLSR